MERDILKGQKKKVSGGKRENERERVRKKRQSKKI
jgi:hypothetical protein